MHSGSANPTIGNDASWMDIVSTITQYGLGAVNVVDDEGQLLGIVTDGDLRRSLQRVGPRDFPFANLRCDDLMTRNPVVTSPEMLAFEALRLMEDRPSQINVLPVVEVERSVRWSDSPARHCPQWIVIEIWSADGCQKPTVREGSVALRPVDRKRGCVHFSALRGALKVRNK